MTRVVLLAASCLAATSLLGACSFQLGRPVATPTEHVVATATREDPTSESEARVATDETHVRVEAHRLCNVVRSRTVERRTDVQRTLSHKDVARGIVVIGALVTVAGVVGVVRPQLLGDAVGMSNDASRITAATVGSAGLAAAVGAGIPLLVARRPGVRVESSTVEEPSSSPSPCEAETHDEGLAIALAFDDRRVSVGRTDASGVLEFAPDAFVPRDYIGPVHVVVEDSVGPELDLAPLRAARATEALASCKSGADSDCDYLSRLRTVAFVSEHTSEIDDVLAERAYHQLDLARCANARSAEDCQAVADFVARNPSSPHADELSGVYRRGRIHAIEAMRGALRR